MYTLGDSLLSYNMYETLDQFYNIIHCYNTNKTYVATGELIKSYASCWQHTIVIVIHFAGSILLRQFRATAIASYILEK